MKQKQIAHTIRLFLILAINLAVFLNYAANVHAQDSDFHLSISPPVNQLRLKPGTTVSHTLKLKNQGRNTLTLHLKPRDFVSDNQSGTPVLSKTFNFPFLTLQNSQISLDKPFTLQPGEEQQLVLEFAVPESANNQEYYFVFLVEGQASQPFTVNSSAAQVSGQIGSTFLITVTDQDTNTGKLEMDSFSQAKIIDSLMDIRPTVFLKNTGQQTTTVQGSIIIKNMLGKEVFKAEIFPANILPGARRQIFAQVMKDKETVSADAMYYPSLFLFGKYTVMIYYNGSNQNKQTFEYNVYAFPFILTGILVASLLMYAVYTKTTLFSFDKASRKK